MKWKLENIKSLVGEPIVGEWGKDGGNVKVLRTTNFTNDGCLDLSEVVVRDIDIKKVQKKKLQFGDTIIEKSGGSPSQPVGRVVYFDIQSKEDYLCNNFTSVLRPNSSTDSKYLFWFLFYNHLTKNTLRFQNKTTGIINLQLPRYLAELQIPTPPLPIQQKIAAILDEADTLRHRDKAMMAKYDELLQAVFYDIFGELDECSDGECLGEIISINPKKSELNITESTSVSFVPMSCVGEKGQFQPLEDRKYSDVKSGFTFFRNNDVLFAKITPCMENGKGAIAKGLTNGIGFGSTEFHVLRPNGNLNAEYLYTYMSRTNFRKLAEKNMTGSAGQKRVSTDFLANHRVNIPDRNTQEKFARIFKNIQEQKIQISQQQTYSGNLFLSLIQRAFKGELVG